MGWTTTSKPKGQSITDFFRRNGSFTYADPAVSGKQITLLDAALVNLKEYYYALEIVDVASQQREVIVDVTIIHMFKEDSRGYNISYKEIGRDTMYTNCPERLMQLLTPTTDVKESEWRALVNEKLALKKEFSLTGGMKFYTNTPIAFTSGQKETEFMVVNAGPKLIQCHMLNLGYKCRLSRDYAFRRFQRGDLLFGEKPEQVTSPSSSHAM